MNEVECAYCTKKATHDCPDCHVGYCESCLSEHLDLLRDGIIKCPQRIEAEIILKDPEKFHEGLVERARRFVEGGEINLFLKDNIKIREGM
jgi:hypothetical protein